VNEPEQEKFEAELRRAAPARLPEHFMARLQAARPVPEPVKRTSPQPPVARPVFWGWLHSLAPATAVAVGVLLVWWLAFYPRAARKESPAAAASGLMADDVKVDEELVSSFDVVATLPGGEPVRFRCRQWKDQLVVTDSNHGVEIEQNSPRVEVVPVRFETY
jgi:hypothetical protein